MEEEDRIQFPDHPFDTCGEGRWDEWDIRSFLKTTKREIGFFRKRRTLRKSDSSSASVGSSRAFLLKTCDLSIHASPSGGESLSTGKRFDPSTPQEQIAELMRDDDDLPEVCLLRALPGVVS